MLEIGQEVFTVCRLRLDTDKPPFKHKVYISRKVINGIFSIEDKVCYRAGKYGELVFRERNSGAYFTETNPIKPVFLTYKEAEKEKKKWIDREIKIQTRYEGKKEEVETNVDE